jgi:hypothetical protein
MFLPDSEVFGLTKKRQIWRLKSVGSLWREEKSIQWIDINQGYLVKE